MSLTRQRESWTPERKATMRKWANEHWHGKTEEKPMEETQAQPGVNLSFEQLQQLMQGMAQTIVTELKKPTADEQAKIDKDKADIERRRNEMIRIGKEEEEMKARTQAACNHLKPNGQMAVGGQRYSDGKVKEFCLRCQKTVREYTPDAADLAGGFGQISDEFQQIA